jgi:hypothetical protein
MSARQPTIEELYSNLFASYQELLVKADAYRDALQALNVHHAGCGYDYPKECRDAQDAADAVLEPAE